MPHRLGRYAVRRRIGSGGFATVWLAYDEQLDAPVAVKVLADNWTEDHQVRTRFIEEGRYLRRVESPHVVSVYDAGELEDGRPYLVMSYADQGTLADRLEVAGMTVAQGLEVVRQVASGLQALHDRGILHRDVKPANVLFRTVDPGSGDTELRAMLGDLGLGKAVDASSRLTMIAGTPSFVAPEQAQGESPDARADQYSLAVLTFLLLGGRTPWTHASLSSAADPPPPPPLSAPGREFPAAVEDVVRRALARERDERWPSVTAYAAALAAALADTTAIEELGGSASGWLGVDRDLTQPGARPTLPPISAPLPDLVEPDLPEPRRRWLRRAGLAVLLMVGASAVLGAGAVGGYLLQERVEKPVDAIVEDDTGTIRVTVPATWDGARSTASWMPPNVGEGRELPALSVGTSADWATVEGAAEGIFVGVLPGTELPEQVPQHLECATASDPVMSTSGDSVTVVFSGCPAGFVVERVVQVNRSQLLWVQIRSDDRPTANRVLSGVEVFGLS
ncbi:MAG: serine/threonine-protein kinase [Nocardioides sp.]